MRSARLCVPAAGGSAGPGRALPGHCAVPGCVIGVPGRGDLPFPRGAASARCHAGSAARGRAGGHACGRGVWQGIPVWGEAVVGASHTSLPPTAQEGASPAWARIAGTGCRSRTRRAVPCATGAATAAARRGTFAGTGTMPQAATLRIARESGGRIRPGEGRAAGMKRPAYPGPAGTSCLRQNHGKGAPAA